MQQGDLRARRNQQVHSSRDAMPVHSLDNVGVKRRARNREIEILIPVHQGDLSVGGQDAVVCRLRRDLRHSNE